MKLPHLKFKVAAILLFFVTLFVAREVNGQSDMRSITIVPPSVAHKLDPGSTAEGKLKVINDSDQPIQFVANVRDFIVEDKKGTPKILAANTLSKKYSGAAWLGIVPDTFTVQPHQKEILDYYLQVPADARPGGHYAVVVYEPQQLSDLGKTGAAVETRLGALFYITVNGPITENAQVVEFKTNTFQEYGPITFTTEVQNLGDLHIRPEASIIISNLFGRVDAKRIDDRNIFPEASYLYSTKMGKQLMFGQYKARFYGTYGVNNNLPLMATVTFWVFPWRIALVVLLALVLVILVILLVRKQRHKHHTSETHTS